MLTHTHTCLRTHTWNISNGALYLQCLFLYAYKCVYTQHTVYTWVSRPFSICVFTHSTHSTARGMNHGHCHIIAKKFRKRNSLPIVWFFRFSWCLSLTISHSFAHIRVHPLSFFFSFTSSRWLVVPIPTSLPPPPHFFLSIDRFMLGYFNVWPNTQKIHESRKKIDVCLYVIISRHISKKNGYQMSTHL